MKEANAIILIHVFDVHYLLSKVIDVFLHTSATAHANLLGKQLVSGLGTTRTYLLCELIHKSILCLFIRARGCSLEKVIATEWAVNLSRLS